MSVAEWWVIPLTVHKQSGLAGFSAWLCDALFVLTVKVQRRTEDHCVVSWRQSFGFKRSQDAVKKPEKSTEGSNERVRISTSELQDQDCDGTAGHRPGADNTAHRDDQNYGASVDQKVFWYGLVSKGRSQTERPRFESVEGLTAREDQSSICHADPRKKNQVPIADHRPLLHSWGSFRKQEAQKRRSCSEENYALACQDLEWDEWLWRHNDSPTDRTGHSTEVSGPCETDFIKMNKTIPVKHRKSMAFEVAKI